MTAAALWRDVALGYAPKLWYLRNFIDFYDATLDPAQKEAFHADAVALSQANGFGPSWGAELRSKR